MSNRFTTAIIVRPWASDVRAHVRLLALHVHLDRSDGQVDTTCLARAG